MVFGYIDYIKIFFTMFYIIYKTKNKINDRFYIGYHKTTNLDDDYLGSGIAIKEAIQKYGRSNFEREILYVFPTREEAIIKEMEIVNEEFINDPQTYNIKIGGDGGWEYVNEKLNLLPEYKNRFKENTRNGIIKSISEGKYDESFRKNGIRLAKMNMESPPFLGKIHSKESKKNISLNNGSKLSKEDIRKRLLELKKTQFGWGWKSKIAEKWRIPHQHVKSFLDKNLIGARIKTAYHISWDGRCSDIEFIGTVKSYFLSEDTENLLMLTIEGDFDMGTKVIGVKEDILEFID
jgi:hypothetical protein